MYAAHVKARAVEEMRQKRDMMIAAYHSNPTWDEKENREQRNQNIRQLNEQFDDARASLYADDDTSAADRAFEEDPLFAPIAKKGRQEAATPPQMPNAGRAKELTGGDSYDPALRI